MRFATCTLLVAVAFGGSTIASGSSADSAGDWEIVRQTTADGDCLMRKAFSDGLVVEAGFVSAKDGAFLAAYHPDWNDITVGETVFMAFHFGDVGFGGDVEAIEVDGLKGGYAFFDNPAFSEELARRDTLTITSPNGEKTDVNLRGTSRAIAAVENCQSAR